MAGAATAEVQEPPAAAAAPMTPRRVKVISLPSLDPARSDTMDAFWSVVHTLAQRAYAARRADQSAA